jgi:23S rRNA (cytidine1920-2'-O)/16S rRNA (cytidine1409-2'-O)-methyltransferase
MAERGVKPHARAAAAGRRERLDRLLVLRKLAESLDHAWRLILAGAVFVDGQRVDKAGRLIDAQATITVAPRPPFVSRGGEKLASALETFGVSPAGRVCLDVGASTGGFTDCLLARGALRVYAVDVGRGQLDAKLRHDPRVVLMERVNARRLSTMDFPEPPDLATVDVSFISLEKILPPLFRLLPEPAEVVPLVKPQFEIARRAVGRGGVVKEESQHRDVLLRLARFAVLSGWHVLGVTPSPLRGPKGNREFFLHLAKRGRTPHELETLIARAVQEGGER